MRTRKRWKTNAIFLVVLWIVLLVASVTILSSVVTPFLRNLQTQNLISLDWGGYAVSSNNLFPQPLVTSVSGSWNVPKIAVSKTDTYSAAWIGIGGQNDDTLIQVGSEHDSINGKVAYSLWYELLPDYAVPISDVDVSAGDKITAFISLTDSQTNNWTIGVTNANTGQTFQQYFNYNSSRLTAEWIIERPTVNNQMTTLANFGSITFTDAKATVANKVGTISAFSNYQINMENRRNSYLVTISELNTNGSSFTISYS